jgi:hypothetical protein
VRRLGAIAAVIAVALAGCGGDEEPRTEARDTATTPTASVPTAPATVEREPPRTFALTDGTEADERPSREDEPGGAGDEIPIASPALFTGRGGRITPREVQVPPFIAIRVELHSLDGRDYGLRFPGARALRTGPRRGWVTLTLDGIGPNRSIVGRPVGAGSTVRVVANAEPGP